jgi:hypothetical protein
MENGIVIKEEQFLQLSKPTTQELMSILSEYDEIKLAVYEKQMTVEKAMEGTSLRQLGKAIDEKNLVKTLVYFINRFSANFNVGKKFTPGQAVTMAMDMTEVLKYETIEDIVLMLKMARTGQIGDGKDFKLDSQTVFHKWIPEYLELKAIKRENLHNRQKHETSHFEKWSPESLEKFIVADKKTAVTEKTKGNGLGQRTKKEIGTVHTSPIVNRRSYLKGLAYQATLTPTVNLEFALSHFLEKKEQDAVDIIQKEIISRNV